jgi:hypothetical protein
MQKNGLTAERTESSIRTHKGFLRERKALLSITDQTPPLFG